MRLEESLSPRPRRVYLLAHPLEPVRRNAHDAVVAAMAPRIGLAAFNQGVFHAGEDGPAALTAANTLPMMASDRLVVITHLEEAPNSFFAGLLRYLEQPSETTCLVLVGSGFPKVVKGGKRWSQSVAKALGPDSWTLNRKATLDLRAFAEDIARSEGKTLDRAAMRTLIAAYDGRVGLLEQEVRKLALFAREQTITAADVATCCQVVSDAETWDLTRAIVDRDAKSALAVLQRLQNQGLDSRQILGTLGWKMRSVAIAADVLRSGGNDSAASKASKMKSFELKKVKAALREGLPTSAELMAQLATANLEMNSYRAGDQRILERLILRWTS